MKKARETTEDYRGPEKAEETTEGCGDQSSFTVCIYIFYWSIIALQCVSFCCTTK